MQGGLNTSCSQQFSDSSSAAYSSSSGSSAINRASYWQRRHSSFILSPQTVQKCTIPFAHWPVSLSSVPNPHALQYCIAARVGPRPPLREDTNGLEPGFSGSSLGRVHVLFPGSKTLGPAHANSISLWLLADSPIRFVRIGLACWLRDH